jgi:hypothetical protein
VAEEDLIEESEWVAEKGGIDGSIPLENEDMEGVESKNSTIILLELEEEKGERKL